MYLLTLRNTVVLPNISTGRSIAHPCLLGNTRHLPFRKPCSRVSRSNSSVSWFLRLAKVTLTRFQRGGKEKFGTMQPGEFYGKSHAAKGANIEHRTYPYLT